MLVSAPTGSGKTVVADYAVARALAGASKAFYTTPLKALSNQKFAELAAVYGPDRVGLLTGDVSHQPDAPVVVMTTEVLRNMLFARSPQLAGLGLVVLDEVHYLQDPYRGSVWEEVIILSPARGGASCACRPRCPTPAQFGAWLAHACAGPTEVVVETHRPVELRNHVAVAEKGSRRVDLVAAAAPRQAPPRGRWRSTSGWPAWPDARAGCATRVWRRPAAPRSSRRSTTGTMLPAIVFIFSPSGCDDAVRQCLDDGVRLTTPEERAEIRRRCEEHTEGLPDDELRVLGYGPWVGGPRGRGGVAPRRADPRLSGGGGGLLLARTCSRWCSPPRPCRSASTCRPARWSSSG